MLYLELGWEVSEDLSNNYGMEWNKNKSKPLAFVEGVTFDRGYSLKPARFMEDMTYDMAGSAAVVGLMKTYLKKQKLMQ